MFQPHIAVLEFVNCPLLRPQNARQQPRWIKTAKIFLRIPARIANLGD